VPVTFRETQKTHFVGKNPISKQEVADDEQMIEDSR
jgi:hypothetical protein